MTATCLLLLAAVAAGDAVKVQVGSKGSTESIVLGEMATLLAQDAGAKVVHKANVGGTGLLWRALTSGAIDIYPEYTGTLREELFRGEDLPDLPALERRLAKQGIHATRPLGFNNSYALGLKESLAAERNIRTISDLKQHPELRLGFSSEFMSRGDGWPSLRSRYGLPQTNVKGIEHALTYAAIGAGQIDLTDAYTTDPNVKKHRLRLLVDDLGHFPHYEALFIYRADLEERAPKVVEALRFLEDKIDDQAMLSLNEQVEIEKQWKPGVAAGFLNQELSKNYSLSKPSFWATLLKSTGQHLLLVGVSLVAAIVVSVPMGVAAAKNKIAGQIIVGGTEIIQTIPGLALLALIIALFTPLKLPTIGPVPAIVALFLYSLLPIIRNTMTGISDVPAALKESAQALGLSSWARLRLIELPLASRLILAGIKTTAVINVGFAALGGLIGAGGYGETIKQGLDLGDIDLTLQGAVPAALLALAVKSLFELSERFVVPKGLRIAAAR
jgi:osmoprotectant transport system permease protein